jgi:protein phosphatase
MSKQSEIDTVELSPPSLQMSDEPGRELDSARVQVDLAGLSHQGLVRKKNEDHYLIVRFGRVLETLKTNMPADKLQGRAEEVGYGMLVADGLGGTAAGEVASSTAISTLFTLVTQTPDWIFSTAERETSRVLERMADRYRQIDAVLRDQGDADPRLAGMATTLTLAVTLGARLVLCHIGDSRVYLLRDRQMHQVTSDHTFVQALVEMSQLTPEQAAAHPLRHVLTRSLGAGDDGVEGEFQRAWLQDQDQLLLCTDGLTQMVDDATIESILGSAKTAHDACEQLVDEALNRGGKDNVTVVVGRYRFPEK